MELIAEYLEIDEPRRINNHEADIIPEWEEFHRSEEHKISVFAGRQTGKTYNLALRAVRSRYNCTIFVGSSVHVSMVRSMIRDLSEPNTITREYASSGREAYVGYDNGRAIRIEVLPDNIRSLRGRRYNNQEVMFDEFEIGSFHTFIEEFGFRLNDARHVVCVGSMVTPYDSTGKRWFNQSGTKCFIDNVYPPNEREYIRHEFFPSELRYMIEHLPPVEFVA